MNQFSILKRKINLNHHFLGVQAGVFLLRGFLPFTVCLFVMLLSCREWHRNNRVFRVSLGIECWHSWGVWVQIKIICLFY